MKEDSKSLTILAVIVVVLASLLAALIFDPTSYVARRLGLPSQFGANLVAGIDFLFITGAMFVQFLVTSKLTNIVFYPIEGFMKAYSMDPSD